MAAADALPPTATLLIIDLQKAIDAPYWGPRNNPDCERNVAALLARWRETRRPINHIKHDSMEPQSAYRPGQPGNDFKDEVRPHPGEAVITKRVNSAFIGTGLGTLFKVAGHRPLIVTRVLTHNSVEATVRMGGNLGFAIYVVSDGCFAVEKKTLDGRIISAEDVHALSLANMHGEYATVVDTAWTLAHIA
ncbi:MAG: cysteine hydrolase family protein [Stellaceae bacterium]